MDSFLTGTLYEVFIKDKVLVLINIAPQLPFWQFLTEFSDLSETGQHMAEWLDSSDVH